MKQFVTKIISAIILFLFTIALFIAETSASNIPLQVEKAFFAKYPSAEDVLWKKYDTNQYLAIFVENEEEMNVFLNENGEVIETLVELREENIPKKISEKLSQMPEGWKINYILKLKTASQFEYYRAKVHSDKSYYEFIFDQNQVLVSVQTIE